MKKVETVVCSKRDCSFRVPRLSLTEREEKRGVMKWRCLVHEIGKAVFLLAAVLGMSACAGFSHLQDQTLRYPNGGPTIKITSRYEMQQYCGEMVKHGDSGGHVFKNEIEACADMFHCNNPRYSDIKGCLDGPQSFDRSIHLSWDNLKAVFHELCHWYGQANCETYTVTIP